MDTDTLLREWSIITGFLPPDWRELARTTGALTREREIRDPLGSFPPGDTNCRQGSRWREFIEARDSLLAVISLPCPPSELLRQGERLSLKLKERARKRQAQRTRIPSVAYA